MGIRQTVEIKRTLKHLIAFLAFLSSFWLLFYVIDRSIPYVKPGVTLVYNAKAQMVHQGEVFRDDAPVRVAIFGNSKILSGFRAEEFDRLSVGRVSAYNFGLGGTRFQAAAIAALCERGEIPTHLFLTLPWTDTERARSHSSWIFKPIRQDVPIVNALFPFRKLPRNTALFVVAARSRGGITSHYQQNEQIVGQMLSDRGYYFIEGQSHYPNDRLPDDFALASDEPTRVKDRLVPGRTPERDHLRALIDRYDLRVIFMPIYYREHQYAEPPPINLATVTMCESLAGFDVVGPDYFWFPNRMFSDPVHLNPSGASKYTEMLWDLFEAYLDQPSSSPLAAGGD